MVTYPMSNSTSKSMQQSVVLTPKFPFHAGICPCLYPLISLSLAGTQRAGSESGSGETSGEGGGVRKELEVPLCCCACRSLRFSKDRGHSLSFPRERKATPWLARKP